VSDHSVHHAGVTVSDLDSAVEFYRDVLGLAVLDRFGVSGEAFATAVDVPEASASFAHLDGGVRVELVDYDPAGDDAGTALNRPGTAHLGLSVDDVDASVEGLPGAVGTVSEPQTTATGTRLAFVRDPDGNLVELLET